MNSMIKNKSRTILVVNDVQETRDGIKQLLETDGYPVETAQNELEAAKKRCLEQINLMLVTLLPQANYGRRLELAGASGEIQKPFFSVLERAHNKREIVIII